MTWLVQHKGYVLVAVGLGLYLWAMRKAVAATDPNKLPIGGRIDSGSKWGTFDVNPDSPTFGEPWFGPLEE